MHKTFYHIITLITFYFIIVASLGQKSYSFLPKTQKAIIDTPRIKSKIYEGIVLNEKGEALDHVKGYVLDGKGLYFRTDENGYFRLITHNTKDTAEVELVKKGFESKKVFLLEKQKPDIFLYPAKISKNNMLFSGFVLDDNNKGIPNAKIFLKENPKIFTISDASGRFKMFVPISKGKIPFIVEKNGFVASKGVLQQKNRQNKLVHLKKQKKYNPTLTKGNNLKGTLYTEKKEPIANLAFQLNGKEYKSNDNGQFEIVDNINKNTIKFKFRYNYTLIRYELINNDKYVYVYLREVRNNLEVNSIKVDSIDNIPPQELNTKKEDLSILIDELKRKNRERLEDNQKLKEKITLLNQKLQKSSSLSQTERDSLKNYILSLENIIVSNEKEYRDFYQDTKAKIKEMKLRLFKKDSIYLKTKKDFEKEQKAKNDIKNDYYNSIIRFSVIILGSLVLIYMFFLLRKRYQNQHKRLVQYQTIIDEQEKEMILQKEDNERLKKELKKYLKKEV